MSLFNNSEKIALRPLLRNNACLVWFNEIPVVETSSALRFIRHVIVNAFHPTWHTKVFDFLPYANYLALYEGWQFDDLTPFMNGSVPVFSLGGGWLIRLDPLYTPVTVRVAGRATTPRSVTSDIPAVAK